MAKHIILIHGRATKPTKAEKERLVRKSLVEGLRRVDATAAKRVEDRRVRVTCAYYGDINNRLMIQAEPDRKKNMVRDSSGHYYEPRGSYNTDLQTLLDRPTRTLTAKEYKKLVRRVDDKRMIDDLARIASPILSLFGLSHRVISKMLPDLGAYFTSRAVGSEVRTRLQRPLKRALLAGDDVCLVSHSMGCIVAYDVLWKFSRMSEYRTVRDAKVSLWMTLGSPLGEPAVKKGLYDADEPDDGRYPANIDRWINVAAKDDFVAHDGDVADDFKEMKKKRLLRSIVDLPRICNFWVGSAGSNPHKFYGYLNHPKFATLLARWMR